MKEKRVIKIYPRQLNNSYDYDLLLSYSHEAKLLYNYCNFIVRQMYFYNSKYEYNYTFDFVYQNEDLKLTRLLIDYVKENNLLSTKLSQILCRYALVNNYKLMSKAVQAVYRKVKADWTSYFKLLKLKKEGSYDKDVNIPSYKKGSYGLVEFNNQTISKKLLNKGYIGTASMKEGFKLPNWINVEDVTSFRVNVKHKKLLIEVLYDKEVCNHKTITIDKNKPTAAIDIGVNILAAITFNFNQRPLVVDNLDIKSFNRLYNRNITKVKSLLPKKVLWSRLLSNITNKRNLRIDNLLGYKTNLIVNKFVELGIKQVIIGKNKLWKEESSLGKVNNQNFVQIPFELFVQKLSYKLKEKGIFVYRQEESYTSKASFLNDDMIPTFGDKDSFKGFCGFSGYRQNRGLYKIKGKNRTIHADINGSYNIMCKAGVFIDRDKIDFLNKKDIIPLNIKVA